MYVCTGITFYRTCAVQAIRRCGCVHLTPKSSFKYHALRCVMATCYAARHRVVTQRIHNRCVAVCSSFPRHNTLPLLIFSIRPFNPHLPATIFGFSYTGKVETEGTLARCRTEQRARLDAVHCVELRCTARHRSAPQRTQRIRYERT